MIYIKNGEMKNICYRTFLINVEEMREIKEHLQITMVITAVLHDPLIDAKINGQNIKKRQVV